MLDALSLCGPRTSVPRSPRYAEVTDARAGRDPTKTFRLRSKMRSEGDRRWALLNKTIRQAFIEHDLVGMRGVGRLPFADKSEGFAAWLRQELAHKVFGMDGRWLLPYVRHAAAIAQTHAEGHAPGSKVDPLRIKMMENYAVNELRGIVEAAQQQIVRMVTHSIMAADSPTKAANALAPVFRTMRNRTRAMSEFVTAKTHATCTLSAFRNAGVTSVGIIPERHKLHDWGPEAWEASAEARRGRAKALARIARAEAWARRYNKKHPGPRPGDRPNAAVLGYSYSSENFGVDTEDARRKPLTPREAAELPWRGEQRVRVPISRPPWLQETENRPIEEVPSYEEVSIETAEDSDVCDLCSDLSEAGPYELDEAEDLIPAHPWAVLEGTTVASYGPVNEMVRARFVGPAVYLRTSAKFFAIGPNHPMLTDRGWLRAHEIKEGDKLLYDLRCEGAIGGASGAYFKQIPFIEDAFETFPLIMAGITGAKHDFHGDIRWCDDKIDVVFPASDLLQIAKLGSIQHGGEHRFARSNVPRHSLTEASTAQQFLLRIFHSACSFVGGANLHPALPFSHAAPFDNFLFRGTAQPNAGLNQRAHNHAPAGSVSTRKRDNAVAALIQRDYALLRWDRVLDVHVRQFSGWAFDASTTSGLYNNAGYIVSNCRCAFTPSRRGSVHDAGDLPGHPFRGNQYVTGEGGGGTEQFKAWFGNSKVVDKNGSPLVVYHGTTTPEDFSEFSVGEPQAQ